MRAMSSRWVVASLFLAALLGVSLGVLADRLALQSDESDKGYRGSIYFDCEAEPTGSITATAEWRTRKLEEMREELRLDALQVENLESIFERHGDRANRFWQETRTSYCELRQQLRSDVRALLKGDQAELFDARLRRLDQQWREKHAR